MKNRVTLLNMISGLILQLCTIASGFIVPRIILAYFGSEVNGLVASLNQFLSYISLVEGGLTGVVVASLYKPLVDNNQERISAILVTAKKFYFKIGCIFIGYTLALAIIYPVFINKDFDFSYTASLTLILSSGLFIQYMFSLSLKTLLDADKKSYIVSLTQCVIILLNIFFAIITVHIYPQIHLLKLVTGCLFIIQPVLFGRYVKKHYSVNWNSTVDNGLINNRWNGLAINIAAFIHNSTDIVILTLLTDLKTVSIYSVYALVTNGLKHLISSSTSGINATVGQAYARKNDDKLKEKLDLYEYVIFALVFFFFGMSILLVTPFVLLYTSGVVDTNYNQPLFGILLSISEALYLIKAPHLGLAYSANKFKEISIPAYIEAGLNIVLSIVLVSKLGLIGVAIGTIVGMTYRMAFHVYYTHKLLGFRRQIVFYKKFGVFSSSMALLCVICNIVYPFESLSVAIWIKHAVVYAYILLVIVYLITRIMFKKEYKYIKSYMKK